MKYFLIANNLFGYFRQLQTIYFGLSGANNLFQCLRLCKQFISKVFISPLPNPQNNGPSLILVRVPKGGSAEPWSPEISAVEPGALSFY